MKHTRHIIAIISILLLASCDRKGDENGALDGMWQLTEWRNETGQVVADQNAGIYYSFQLKLMKVQVPFSTACYLSHFVHQDDELIVGQPTHWPTDSIYSLSELTKYGVPADGHFHVDALSSSRLVLSSETGRLSFRKY